MSGGDSTIRGLAINSFKGTGIQLKSNHNSVIGNYLGLTASGTVAANGTGILVTGLGNTIGGVSLSEQNVISGNSTSGVYLSGTGAMDTSIVIRTFLALRGQVYFQAGGGIVADSDPELEYRETVDKARALIQALSS